ncbi:hypothetical protein QYF36_009066 [Acer negundo]|nr:hypothetical protein QYF36_009066 [Acer negundo]
MEELQNVLHMNEGEGDNSYAKNSGQQKQAILKAKPFLQESIVELYNNIFPEDCMRGNQSKEDSIKNYRPMLLELIGMELEAMVSEGIVEEWKLDTFNVPLRLSIRAKDSMEKGLGMLTNMLISLTKK